MPFPSRRESHVTYRQSYQVFLYRLKTLEIAMQQCAWFFRLLTEHALTDRAIRTPCILEQ